jgi:2-methylcitrate dehydratase PrpD
VVADPTIAEDAVHVEVDLTTGERIHRHVDHAIGNLGRPMTDRELEEKFLDQAQAVLPVHQVRELIALCWKIGELRDMRQFVEAAIPR